MKGNSTRIILNERLTAANRSKITNKHYSPKAHFNHSNNKNSLTNSSILNSPILHTYTKSNGNNHANNHPSNNNLNNNSNKNLSRFNTNSNGNNNTDNLKVAIRVRPPLPREIEKNLPFRAITLISKENHTCSLVEYLGVELDEEKRQKEWISNPKLFQLHRFTFDEVFDLNTSQEEVFNISAKPAVISVLEGYNSTIFAYGQTGTGKTFTMEGFTYNNMDNTRGIIPRTIECIFSYIESNSNKNTKFIIRAAYLQIYNEMISDLLKPENSNKNLSIREDKKKGLYVDDLSEWAVRNPSDIYALLERGATCREVSNTFMNDVSSRSHAVFMITVEQLISKAGKQITKIGKLNLVDLAGSERTRITGATGKQLQESIKINKSLSALGNVINALTDTKERKHIPYRDSKLTRLLEDSLGGNCKTTMIATISPAQCSFNESLSTLNFARRAKNIKNRPVINEDIDHNGLIHQYENELKKIRKELEEKNKIIELNEEILKLKNREEKEKIDAIKAYEQTSRQLLIEREEKQKLENKIQLMNLQMIKGGEKIEETPQFKSALQEMEKDFEKRILEIKKEKEQIEDSKSQVEAYNKLLYQQRDIMNSLSMTLNEKEEAINDLIKNKAELEKAIIEMNKVLKIKDQYIIELEKILDNNKIKHKEYSKLDINNIKFNNNINNGININNNLNKIVINKKAHYIPYQLEQNGKEFITKAMPLLTSEEKIKELNDIVKYKNKEIFLLKKVSEKCLGLTENLDENDLRKKIKELQTENIKLQNDLKENNQMINLQRKENQSLEEHYTTIEKIFQRTEKENLELINIKEKIISNLEQIIKKIDNEQYNFDEKKNFAQLIRTDLVYIFQIILNSNNSKNSANDIKEKGNGKLNLNLKLNINDNNNIINNNYNFEDQVIKTEANVTNKTNKKLSSEMVLKDTKELFKKNSLEDFFSNDKRNNNKSINEKKGKEFTQKNNIKSIHDYKNSAGGNFHYKNNNSNNGNKIESKNSKKNPFEQSLINKDNKKNKK